MRYSISLVAVAVGVALSSGAYAADLPPTYKLQPLPPAHPAFSWAGAYIGVYGGVAAAHTTSSDLTSPAFTATPALNATEATFGVLGGYNWAWDPLVLGLEGEVGYDHRSASGAYLAGDGLPRTISESGGALDRMRARAGYALGNTLVFAAGGVSFTDLTITFNNPATGYTQQITNWQTGWNLGAGVEWAFDDHWTVRGEYIYDKLPSTTYPFKQIDPNGFDSRSINLSENTVRMAVAYKF